MTVELGDEPGPSMWPGHRYYLFIDALGKISASMQIGRLGSHRRGGEVESEEDFAAVFSFSFGLLFIWLLHRAMVVGLLILLQKQGEKNKGRLLGIKRRLESEGFRTNGH
jgi:hypothetical protein